MGDQKYDIVFRGKLVSGANPGVVRANVARMFKTDESKIAGLFSGARKVLKRGLDRPAADKYRAALKNAGAVVAIVSAQVQEQARSATAPAVVAAPAAAAPGIGRKVEAAYDGKASFQVDEPQPDPDPAAEQPADQGIKAAYDGRASFQVDETPPEPEPPAEKPPPERMIEAAYDGKASFQVDDRPPEPEPLVDDPEPRKIEAAYEGTAEFQLDESPTADERGPADTPPPVAVDEVGDLEFEAGLAPVAGDHTAHSEPEPAEAEGAYEGALEFESIPLPSVEDSASLAPPGEQIVEPVKVAAPDIDTSRLSVEADYDVLDNSERPEAPEIDTGNLATSEDFDALDASERLPAPDIDTGDLDMLEVGATVDEARPLPKPEIDTSGLSIQDDFEALESRPAKVTPEIDISQLSLADDESGS